jgi:hypothetical protein
MSNSIRNRIEKLIRNAPPPSQPGPAPIERLTTEERLGRLNELVALAQSRDDASVTKESARNSAAIHAHLEEAIARAERDQ